MTTRFFHPLVTGKKPLPFSVHSRDIILTILMWWLYIYFMKDLFLFLADVVRWGGHGFMNAGIYKSFDILPTLLAYLEAMAGFMVIYVGWARYNQMRFRGKTRRRGAGPVEIEDLAKFYRLDARQVEAVQQAKTIVIRHDARGHIIEMEMG